MTVQTMPTNAPVPRAPAGALPALAAGASLELVGPADVAALRHLTRLPPGTRVYLPNTARSCAEATVDACRVIASAGLTPVPHVAARAVPSRRWLTGWLQRLNAAGTDTLLLIAGDQRHPAGPFDSTLALLDTGVVVNSGFRRLAVAGHPEGHPVVHDAVLQRALETKAAYARATGTEMWLVTQFVFEAERVLAWMRRLYAAGLPFPVRVGVPGVARLQTLWHYALRCGVAASTRVIGRRPRAAFALAGSWRPDALVTDLAREMAAGSAGAMVGIHLYPFGGVRAGVEWLGALGRGLPSA